MQQQQKTITQISIPQFLTQSQKQICYLAQQFTQKTNAELENKLKQSKWQDIYTIIQHPNIDNNIRIVCCSVLKWLIYHTKFVTDPIAIFRNLGQFYITSYTQNGKLTKAQQIVQIVLQAIPSTYLKQKQKQQLIQQILGLLPHNCQKSPKILKLCQLILQTISQAEIINNQIISGQILLYLQKILPELYPPKIKIAIIKEALKILQTILQLVNNQDQVDSNVVEQFLQTSTLAKTIIQQIISDGSNGKQVIMEDRHVNQIKLIALQLYTSIWVYYSDQNIFRLCLNSLLTRPKFLLDQQADILQLVLKIIQRSISQQAYYHILHINIQPIIMSLLDLLCPKQSTIKQCTSDPDQFADFMYDFCMQQQRQTLQTKVGSLISSLCLYIDGYMSFLGSLCIMVIKDWNGSLNSLQGGVDYMKAIYSMWQVRKQDRVAVCVLVLCAISDQLEKRQDLVRPLRVQIAGMSHLLKLPECRWPPYIVCRFMFLYSFLAYPKCLDPFLQYVSIHQCYVSCLQSCYKILIRYYSKYPQLNSYIMSIAPLILLSDHLTSLLQSTIITGQISQQFQYKILQKLVIWLQEGLQSNNKIVVSKMTNLISMLLQRMKITDYDQQHETVHTYISNPIRKISKKQYAEFQQFILQIMIAYVKRFPNLQKYKDKLNFLLQIGFVVVERNHGVLNNCLDLFYQITRHLPYDLLLLLIQVYMGCLESQQREEDSWECYYGLEACMIRIGELRVEVPNINIAVILAKIDNYNSVILKLKTFMFVLSFILVNPSNPTNPIQYLPSLPPPFPTIPPYQNKPYLLYYLLVLPKISYILNPKTSYQLLSLLLELLNNQPKIRQMIKQYQQQIYNNMQQINQVTINAFGISQRLMHPLLGKGFDVYNQFRKCWDNWPYKEEIKNMLNHDQRKQVMELCTQTVVGVKVRKILRVKHQDVGDMM